MKKIKVFMPYWQKRKELPLNYRNLAPKPEIESGFERFIWHLGCVLSDRPQLGVLAAIAIVATIVNLIFRLMQA